MKKKAALVILILLISSFSASCTIRQASSRIDNTIPEISDDRKVVYNNQANRACTFFSDIEDEVFFSDTEKIITWSEATDVLTKSITVLNLSSPQESGMNWDGYAIPGNISDSPDSSGAQARAAEITRGEACNIIYSVYAYGTNQSNSTDKFASFVIDSFSASRYADSIIMPDSDKIAALDSLGALDYVNGLLFKPLEKVTRKQFMFMLYRVYSTLRLTEDESLPELPEDQKSIEVIRDINKAVENKEETITEVTDGTDPFGDTKVLNLLKRRYSNMSIVAYEYQSNGQNTIKINFNYESPSSAYDKELSLMIVTNAEDIGDFMKEPEFSIGNTAYFINNNFYLDNYIIYNMPYGDLITDWNENMEAPTPEGQDCLLTIDYPSGAESIVQFIDEKTDRVLKNLIYPSMTEEEKIKALYDYIISNVTYDWDVASQETYGYLESSSYSALKTKKAVCTGYAVLFKYLLEKEGIHSVCVLGDSEAKNGDSIYDDDHIWNLIKIDDKYYYFDATWDDWDDGQIRYDYFEKTAEDFSTDHNWDEQLYLDLYNELYQ